MYIIFLQINLFFYLEICERIGLVMILNLMFTDEPRFDLGGDTRVLFRLDSNLSQKLKNWEPKAYDLINR